jgi:hypothetical protein
MKWTGKQSFLGIAFGERSVGVAEIGPPSRGGGGGSAGGAWEVRRAAEFQPSSSLDDAATVDAFKAFLREFGFGASRAVVGVPARWVVAREREVPPSSDEQASSVLRMQAERMFSAELGELTVDYAGTADPTGARNVLLVALPKRQLERVVKLVEGAGREVAAVMPSTLALSDAIAPDAGADGLVLNIGGDAVELSARRGGAPKLLRHLSARGNDFASANGAREAAVTSLAGEIRRPVALMPRGGGMPVGSTASAESLHLWDGVGLGAGDATTLARQAGVDLRGGDAPLRSMGLTGKSPEVARFAPALALAVAGARPHRGAVDFLHPRLAPPKKRRIGRRGAWAIAIASAAAMLLLALWIDVRWSESNVADLKSKLDALKPAVQTSELTAQHISTARGWYPEGRPAVLDCLHEIAAAFPDNGEPIYVLKFTLPETRHGSFSGKSPNRALVLDLVDRLHANKNFADVKPDYTLDAGGSSNEVAFSISFTYQGASSQTALPAASSTQPATTEPWSAAPESSSERRSYSDSPSPASASSPQPSLSATSSPSRSSSRSRDSSSSSSRSRDNSSSSSSSSSRRRNR